MHPESNARESTDRDTGVSRRSGAPTLTQAFAAYLSGEMTFERVRSEVLAAHRALCHAGTPPDAILRFMRRSLDTGAARADASDNVHRFNAIHDELAFWLTGVCGQRGSDAVHAEPMLADVPRKADQLDELHA
ncbi:MAG TPA: hypothetical protein VGT98_00990 [Candidatus Elarobacter sp.]|nr:hypothetical protein [Candidatus Elarobacter sp.]